MPLQATSGAASYDAFGGGVPAIPQYIEEVFQTWLYSGNSSTQTITNGIDLSTKGGMVWTKSRNAAYDNTVYDTARGTGNNKALYTDTTDAQGAFTSFQDLTAYNTNGYSIGSPILLNETGKNYVSWTFRKQPKFFDVVTYTGNGANGRAISHNLGSTPGFILIKRTSSAEDWIVYHRSLGQQYYAVLNSTIAFQGPDTTGPFWNTAPTDTTFTVRGYDPTNLNGSTYVAYLFAHNAGGFGLTGTDNVISCGSYTGNGSTSGPVIDLGYEPQWIMIKNASITTFWRMFDNMRGIPVSGSGNSLEANTSAAEAASDPAPIPTATGFRLATTNGNLNGNGNTMIYIAIRRGPMKVPTSGTSVFFPATVTESGNTVVTTTGFPVDTLLTSDRAGNAKNAAFGNRFTNANSLSSSSSRAELSADFYSGGLWDSNTTSTGNLLGSGNTIKYFLRRAPSFFDVVCYTGSGFARVDHNLQARPELILVKSRSASGDWAGVQLLPDASDGWNKLSLNLTGAGVTVSSQTGSLSSWMRTNDFMPGYVYRSDGTTPTSSGVTYVAYLFASCPGVSKVGSYTGNGSTQTINCGFPSGARFVLIRRTDSTGDWYVYDTARGMTVLTDPYLFMNTSGAEAATLGSVTTVSTGFALNSTILAAINVSGGTYIFLAIA